MAAEHYSTMAATTLNVDGVMLFEQPFARVRLATHLSEHENHEAWLSLSGT